MDNLKKACLECRKTYISKRVNQKYCSKVCSDHYHNKKNGQWKDKITIPCKNCGNHFQGHPSYKFCSHSCSRQWNYNLYSDTQLNTIAPATVGTIAEIIISSDLLKRGYEVYRALSPSSDSDLIAIKKDNIYKIEVRTGRYRRDKDGNIKVTYPVIRTQNKFIAVYTHSDSSIHYIDNWVL